ncbi:MAG: FSR family fosmidomycin resistance protein-like MFS transporter [Rhodoferax sp.]
MGILVWLVLKREKLSTRVMSPKVDGTAEYGLAFMKLPVVWWCFSLFLLSTMTLAVVQNFSVSTLKVMHSVNFEAATVTLTAYRLCGAAGMLVGASLRSGPTTATM